MANQTAGPKGPDSLDDILNQAETTEVGSDPLNQMGYEPATNAERQQEIDDFDGTADAANQTPLDTLNDALDMGEDIKDTVDQAKNLGEKVKEWRGKGAEEAGKTAEGAAESGATTGAKAGAKEGAEQAARQEATAAGRTGWLQATKGKIADGQAKVAARQAARTAEKQALKQGGKQLGKAAAKYGAKAAARWTVEAASGLADAGLSWVLLAADVLLTATYALLKKYGKYVAAALIALMVLPGLLLALFFGALGSTSLPNTPTEKAQVSLTSAFAGQENLKTEKLIELAKSEKARYVTIQRLVNEKEPASSAAVKTKIAAIEKLIDEVIKVGDNDQRQALIKQIIELDKTLAQSLPVGAWIVALAEKYKGTTTRPDSDGENAFSCSVATRSCASFVSTVLQEAGVTKGFSANTLGVWRNPTGRVIIDRGGALDLAKLQPGDVVFFGDGSFATYEGALFNHVGFYVGNGMIIDTSSKEKKVVKRSINVHQGRNSFAAAMRFGR